MLEPRKQLSFPRIVYEGDQLWLRCQVGGEEAEVEISVDRGFDFLNRLAAALWKLARR